MILHGMTHVASECRTDIVDMWYSATQIVEIETPTSFTRIKSPRVSAVGVPLPRKLYPQRLMDGYNRDQGICTGPR